MAKKKKNKLKGILIIEVPVRDQREDIRIAMFNKMVSKTNTKQLDAILDMAKELVDGASDAPLGYQEMIQTLVQHSTVVKK